MNIEMSLNSEVDLKKSIIEAGYSMSGFARAVGVSRGHIYKIVNNQRYPSVELANRIEKKLKMKHHSIFSVTYVSKKTQSV